MTEKQRLVLAASLRRELTTSAYRLESLGVSRRVVETCRDKAWVYITNSGRVEITRSGRDAWNGTPQVECGGCGSKIEIVGFCDRCTALGS
jgi:hypothetical protein